MDILKSAMAEDGLVRVRAVITTDLVKDAKRRHGTSPLATTAIGRALTVAALYPLEEGKVEGVSFQFSGSGPLGTVYAEILAEIEKNGYDVLGKRASTSLPKKFLLAARAWRRSKRYVL